MITRLTLDNFKSWESTGVVRLAPISGVFGANSSGKTSLLQLLLLLKQTADSPDRALPLDFGNEQSQVSLGTFADVVYRHDDERSISWSIAWRPIKPLEIQLIKDRNVSTVADENLAFTASVGLTARGEQRVAEMYYDFAGMRFGMSRLDSKNRYQLSGSGSPGFEFQRSRGRPPHVSAPLKSYGFPDLVKSYFLNAEFLSDFELAFEQLFSNVYYLGPLRTDPQRQYTWGGAQPSDVGRRGERSVDALLAARARDQKVDPGYRKRKIPLDKYVAMKLRDMGLVEDLDVEEVQKGSRIYQVWVKYPGATTRVLLTDVGFGVSQVLPVVTLLYYVPEGSTVVLEQPEIHLHPAVQSALADVFIDAIERRSIQIVLESHSEHLLQRLQLRIAEEALTPDDVALYFVDIESGRSSLTSLDVDPLGYISNWPPGFFGDRLAEASSMSKAAARRNRA